jgi:hypothetical protein
MEEKIEVDNVVSKLLLFQKIFEKENGEYKKYCLLYNKYNDKNSKLVYRIKRLYKINPYMEEYLNDNFFLYVKRIFLEKVFKNKMDEATEKELKKMNNFLEKNIKSMYGSIIYEMKRFIGILKSKLIEKLIENNDNNDLILEISLNEKERLMQKLIENGICIY